jgi:hypothetical protein
MNMKYVNSLVVAALALGCGSVQAGSIQNPGFETAISAANWSTVLNGGSANRKFKEFTTTDPVNTTPYSYYAQEGNYFLQIGAGFANSWVSVYQTVTNVNVGDTFSGRVAFDWQDITDRFDGLSVRIHQGTSISEASKIWDFSRDGTNSPRNPDYPATSSNPYTNYYNGPWETWSWTALAAGTFTFEYAVKNTLQNVNSSFGYFDAIPSVPEPASLSLFVIALAGLGSTQRRKILSPIV